MPRHVSFAVLLALLCLVPAQAGPLAWRWDKDGDLEGWTGSNYRSLEARDGMLRGVSNYDPILISPPVEIDAARFKYLEFRVQSSVSGGGEVFWHGAGQGFSEERMSRHALIASGQPRVYVVDMSKQPGWEGLITGLRLDLLNKEGASLALDYVRLRDRDLGVVPNASFEDDFDGDGRPDGWTARAADFRLTEDHAVEGSRAALVASGAGPEAVLSTRVPLDALGRFRLEAETTLEGPATGVAARLRFFDVSGRPLPGAPVTITAAPVMPQVRLAGDFPAPGLAASAELTLVVTGPQVRAWWDLVKVTPLGEQPDLSSAPLESWRAKWIWAAATAGKDNVPAYLRKTFDLPVAPATVTAARAQVTADDTYQLFVNGKEVSTSTDTDGWRTPEMIDLRPYLVPGRNVIAALARDVASAEGFLLEGGIAAPGIAAPGFAMDLLTDGSWRAAGEAPPDFAAPLFDDSAWPPAQVIAAAGREPWGYLPYTYLGARERVALLAATLPAAVTAGGRLTFSATLRSLPLEAATNPLRLALLHSGQMVFGRVYDADKITATPGGVRLGPFTVDLTRFLPPGTYQLALGYPRTEYKPGSGIVIGSVRVKAPSSAEAAPRVEIRRHGGLPTLFVNGKPTSFMHYLEITNGADRIGNMAANGVHLYEVDAIDIGWLGRGKFDYSAWDRKVLELLTYDPQALIMPTFDVSGLQHRWWLESEEAELCRTESGSTSVGIYGSAGKIISLASTKWRTVSGDATRRFVEHCSRAPYASRVIGYQPCSGVSWEWQHWGSVGPFDPGDYSEPMQAAFRAWVRKAYAGDETRLRAAWRQPAATFDAVRIPTVEQRDGPPDRVFRDPAQWQYVIDFYKFYQDVMVDGIEHYFRIVKEASDFRAIVGTYYGYELTMLGGARRAGDAGHFALRRLLQSRYCDFLMSPLDYSERAVGESYQVMSPIGSVLAHDKLWVLQDDLRTHLVTDPQQRAHGAPEGLAGTVSQLERGYAIATVKGATTQWYDFSNGWIARDRRQGQIIGRLQQIDRAWVNWPDRGPDPNSVAVVVDEESPSAYMSHAFEVNFWAVYRQKSVFEHTGAPINFYLLKDVIAGKVPKFRCYFFLNCYKIGDADRKWLVTNLQGGDRTLVWLYAPGYVSDSSLDVRRLAELTGMEFAQRDEPTPWRVTLKPDAPLGKDIDDWVQPNIKLTPVFVPAVKPTEVAGVYEGTDLPALTVRKLDDWTSVYSATPLLSPLVLKRIIAASGVAVVVEGSEPSYVSRGLVGLHAAAPRTERLHFGRAVRVTDLMTGEVLGTRVKDLEVKLGGPQTRLLRVEEVRSAGLRRSLPPG